MPPGQSKLQKYSAPALEKGLDILEYLSLTDTRPTLSQLALGIGRSKSEIFRMMIVLEERGYIRRTDGDMFSLTDRVSMLGSDRSDESRIAELAAPYINRLAEETELSNHLMVVKDDWLVVIASTSASQSYGLTVQVGYRTALFGTSAGACFLSDIADRDRRLRVMKHLVPQVDGSRQDNFDDMARRCRRDGAIACSSLETNAICELSAPVRHTRSDTTIGALTIPYFANETIDNRRLFIGERLLETVRQMQEKIAIAMPDPRINALHDMVAG